MHHVLQHFSTQEVTPAAFCVSFAGISLLTTGRISSSESAILHEVPDESTYKVIPSYAKLI